MNNSLRWMLILGCLMLAALEAPRSSLVMAEDLTGPYCELIVESSSQACAAAPSPVLASGPESTEHELFGNPGARAVR